MGKRDKGRRDERYLNSFGKGGTIGINCDSRPRRKEDDDLRIPVKGPWQG